MARGPGRRLLNGSGSGALDELPPSTLASRLDQVNGHSNTKLDRSNFNQLLDVALGTDEDGQSNLTDDVEVNKTLLCIVFQAGIDPLLSGPKDNPFQTALSDQNIQELTQCLECVRLVVEKCPQILSSAGGPMPELQNGNSQPFFSSLLAQLTPFLGLSGGRMTGTVEKVRQIVRHVLAGDSTAPSHDVRRSEVVNCLLERVEALNLRQGQLASNGASNANDETFHTVRSVPTGHGALLSASRLLEIISCTSVGTSQLNQVFSAITTATIVGHYRRLLQTLASRIETDIKVLEGLDEVVQIVADTLINLCKIAANLHINAISQQICAAWPLLIDSVSDARLKGVSSSTASLYRIIQATRHAVKVMPLMAQHLRDDVQVLASELGDLEVSQRSQRLDDSTGHYQVAKNGNGALNDYDNRSMRNAEAADWNSDRPSKRLRLSAEGVNGPRNMQQETSCQYVTRFLSGRAYKDLVGINKTAIPYFRKLKETKQVEYLMSLGSFACLFARSESLQGSNGGVGILCCDICKYENSSIRDESDQVVALVDELLKTLLALRPTIPTSGHARVTALLTLRQILLHGPVSIAIELSKSTCGEWVLQSLRSSNKDVRLAAIQVMSVFIALGPSTSPAIVRQNRIVMLDFLQTMTQHNDDSTHETIILCLTSNAKFLQEDELNIVLVRLTEYLGHGNPYIAGLVYSELQRLAEALKLPMSRFLPPFFRTIAIAAMKNITVRPAIVQQLCELLGWPIDAFLTRIEEHAVPYFVMLKRNDLLKRTAEAHEPALTPFELCTQKQILKNIAALLLTQTYADPEDAIMALLLNVSREFKEYDLASWLTIEAPGIACELLKLIGDSMPGRSSKPLQALNLMAQLLSRRANSSTPSKRSDGIGSFLESSSLSIVNHSIFALSSDEARDSIEKRRVLVALGELVRLARGRVIDALPQISACLKDALSSADLVDAAFRAWSMMMRALKSEESEAFVDQTFALVVRYWPIMSEESQKLATEVVSELWTKHSSSIQDGLISVPSLASIPSLKREQASLAKLDEERDEVHAFENFVRLLQNENLVVVEQALEELISFLASKEEILQQSIVKEQPDQFVEDLTRALLDACVRFKDTANISLLCGQNLGLIGCLDPNKLDITRPNQSITVLSNFAKAQETVDFIVYLLEHVIVKSFLSAPSTRAQGFLAWAMQELLKLCNFDEAVALRSRTTGNGTTYRKWLDLPESVQNTLAPFLNSKYIVQDPPHKARATYPIFAPGKLSYHQWLRSFCLDLLDRAVGDNFREVCRICRRIITGQDSSIPSFLLPFAALNLIVGGTEIDKADIVTEIQAVLSRPVEGNLKVQDDIRLCSETVFEVWDYLYAWLQQKRKSVAAVLARADKGQGDMFLQADQDQCQSVELVLSKIPAEILSSRAIYCKSYARALFHWEHHMRNLQVMKSSTDEEMKHFQKIYAEIDEPDGVEGIASQIHVVDFETQVLEHRKAGRWTAAQSWYEMQLTESATNEEAMTNLMQCLKESGQYDALLHRYDSLQIQQPALKVTGYALEAAWTNGRWEKLADYLIKLQPSFTDFNCRLAAIFDHLRNEDKSTALQQLTQLQSDEAASLSSTSTSSLQSCQETLLKLHITADVLKAISGTADNCKSITHNLKGRLDIVGTNVSGKFYVLGAQRAAMELSKTFDDVDMASTWLTAARLARKFSSTDQAFASILRASQLGEQSATLELAKLYWQQDHHRKAIQTLQGAIESQAFASHSNLAGGALVTLTADQEKYQNEVIAKAYVLLGKWQDSAGASNQDQIIRTFRKATEQHRAWEKGWYNLGKYYNKLLDSERTKEPGKESQPFLSGEAAKLVIDNYLRAANCGTKYIFQTLPRVLTLWLEMIAISEQGHDARRGNEKFHAHNAAQRKIIITNTHEQLRKYAKKLRPVALYTILSQMVARVCHQNNEVYDILGVMIMRVVEAYPQQALWTALSMVKSASKDRQTRGLALMRKVSGAMTKAGKKSAVAEFSHLYTSGQKIFDELLRVSDFTIDGKASRISLARDLGFNHKIAPTKLVVPVEHCLMPSLPLSFDPAGMKTFTPFPREPVTVSAFLDEAVVLASLQKPRKLSLRGSDGNIYGVMAKPKDDLRKDQRLMEFNTMINRFLKRDVEASRRRLSIRTYAVVPLNEECGLIEWVENLKTLRDILLKLYKERNVAPNYIEIRSQLDEACSGGPEKVKIFEDRVLKLFPPRFHVWFKETFPEPTAWFNARLRYTRSAAVMSMVGHVLGLGDRHGENILFEEDTGGTLHVDFNCLFDKGLTFEKPECVPFRLTHNMTDAMGPFKFEGPFRRCSEITLGLLRTNEDSLMTILETFLHDPTTDFIDLERRKKRNKNAAGAVPDTPAEVLEVVRAKVRGMLAGESVPLSVGGYVEEMIRRATDPANLCRMYIGWCAFF